MGYRKKSDNKESTVGQKILLQNYSSTPQYSSWSGVQLPFKGMAVQFEGNLYANYDEVRSYIGSRDADDSAVE